MNDTLFFFVIIGIPTIGGLAFATFALWIRHRERMAPVLASATAEKAAQYAAHTERLEQRVRVLERIVTDRGVDVAEEIEKLRDAPLN